ncbi:MFS transporter [Mycobacterium sp. 21AC1]|uniref:MFS transporter n=1 Tax=[Mycobacterium] appelbergii TaxID=2939269 RepID=UPI0029392609|nr:MFS transporter [Mycobacterium sp. 21AC1]MDV3127182.1 MFS transporter [Mycobacterium sp. 21AC1]
MGDGCDTTDREQAGRTAVALVALLGVTFLAFVNYAALLPVVPMWAVLGGATDVAVGVTTGAMMAATVLTQMAMLRLSRTVRLRSLMLAGLLLLGAPTPLYLLSTDFAPIMAITILRGIGFAFMVTAGATLVGTLAGTGRLASSASWYGVAAALPNIGALAGGVWATEALGYALVFWASGAACIAAAFIAWSLPNHRSTFRLGNVALTRRIALPLILFALTAGAFGAVTTFLALSGPTASVSATALLAASTALVAGRLLAGYVGDRRKAAPLLFIAVIVAACGVGQIGLSLDGHPVWLIAGASLLGAGFGASQNDSFVATVERLGRDNSGTASTIWNATYDGGLGAGAVALGGAIGYLGYDRAFLAMAAAMIATIVVAPRSIWKQG